MLYLHRPLDELFKLGILRLLAKHFDFDNAVLGFLGNINERKLSPNISENGVGMPLAQNFLKHMWDADSPCKLDKDIWTLSEDSDYTRTRLYRSLLKPNGYSDCALIFLNIPGKNEYVAYVAIFKTEGTFNLESVELFEKLARPISIAEDNYLKIWNLQNTMKLLQSCTNFFPLGIMIIENLDHVTYTNDLAKEYLKELGYSDPQFYNAFYLNELYNHFQYDVLNFGANKPIRIKRFLFNIQTLSNPGKGLANMDRLLDSNQSKYDPRSAGTINYREMTTCVYIVSDKNYKANMNISQSTMERLGFTNRERQLVDFLVQGLSNQDISDKMMISINTVKIHISNVFRKAKVRSRTELLDKLYNLEREN